MHEFNEAFPHWLKYSALGGKHLPFGGGFLDQPGKLMDHILEIDSIFEKMKQQLLKQWRDQDSKNA